MLSRFYLIPERYGQTDRYAISTRDKKTTRRFVVLKLTTDRHETSRGLFATAEIQGQLYTSCSEQRARFLHASR